MPLGRFTAYTAAGTVLWTSLLTAAGWLLGNGYDRVGVYLDPVTNVVCGALLFWYLYRVATFRRAERA